MFLSSDKLSSLRVVGVDGLVAGPGEVVLLVLVLAAPAHRAQRDNEDGGGHHTGAHGGDQRHPLHRLVMSVLLTPHTALTENIIGNYLFRQNYNKRNDNKMKSL